MAADSRSVIDRGMMKRCIALATNAWNPTREMYRFAVNAWIRESGVFDGVAHFDAALRDPEIPTQMRAVDDCGDGLNLSDGGYCKMGDAIDLALFA